MAVENKTNSIKRKKRRKKRTEEEVVITLGKPPEEEEELEEEEMEEEDEEEIELGEEAEEDEDVVVISIGKPPKKEEEVVEEEIEEVVEVEGEPVEVEVEEEKPPEEEEKALKRKKLAAIIIAIIVVIGSIGIYVIFVLNKDPVAKLQLSPESPFAGQLVLMDASNSTDDKGIEEYTWSFGDQTAYTETKTSAPDGKFDGKTTHSYDEGDYTVGLTVKDQEGRTGTASSRLAVSELVVTIPFEMIGDDYTFDVNGSVDVDNNDGIWTGSTSLGKFTLKNVHIDFDGYMLSRVEGVTSQEDGFGESHETLERYNFEDVEMEGTVSGTLTTESPPSTIDTTLPIQDGSLEVTERDYTDLTTNKTIFSDTESYLIISATGFDVWSDDHLRSYSNLREKSAVLRIEDLSLDRSFKMDDSQIQRVGDISYTWRVESVANIQGYPALGIEIDIDPTTKRENNIEEFEMWLWITNNIPLPIRTYIYTEIYYEGTTTIIIYNNEIQQDGFVRGTTDIPYGDCFTTSPDDHYHFRNPGFEFLSWDDGEYIPDLGSSSSSLDNFPPQDAIAFAEANSAGLQDYLASYPNAYVIDGHYNDTKDDPPLWNLTFGDKNAGSAYYVVVEFEGGSYSLVGETTIDPPEIVNSSSDFDLVLSFSASEQVFESDEEINQTVFLGGNIKFYDGFNYGVRANMIYPSISLTISLTLEHAEYGYYLEDDDGSLSAAVDAINGQLIYVWEHDGDDILSLIIG